MENKKILWISRHEMSKEQKEVLGSNIEITQIDKTLANAYEIKDDLLNADVVAVVAPVNIQKQIKSIINDNPMIVAKSDRLPDGTFKFDKWEEVKAIIQEKHDYQSQDNKKVLWFSRNEMSESQIEALGKNAEITQLNKTVQNVRGDEELMNAIKENDILAIVGPENIQQQFLSVANEQGDKPVIMAKSNRVLVKDENGGESKTGFDFVKWEQIDKIEVIKEDYIPELIEISERVKDFELNLQLAETNNKVIDFLHDKGFSCEVIENHGVVASLDNNTTLLLSPRTDGRYAAKATSLSRDEVLFLYKADTEKSPLESDRQIGWWAYENENLPSSEALHINNHNHNLQEIKNSVKNMIEKRNLENDLKLDTVDNWTANVETQYKENSIKQNISNKVQRK